MQACGVLHSLHTIQSNSPITAHVPYLVGFTVSLEVATHLLCSTVALDSKLDFHCFWQPLGKLLLRQSASNPFRLGKLFLWSIVCLPTVSVLARR